MITKVGWYLGYQMELSNVGEIKLRETDFGLQWEVSDPQPFVLYANVGHSGDEEQMQASFVEIDEVVFGQTDKCHW